MCTGFSDFPSQLLKIPVSLDLQVVRKCLEQDDDLADCTTLSVDYIVTLLRFVRMPPFLKFRDGTFY